ncbi:uncharacterized protein [Acropora muricata]|uniref:uncharacterized protein LOC114962411 n=1 Tax=Acropora millepora TaxID=45264 RepID=UPI0010FCC6D5|nr:uncharacterized protein LOC114962411 [Acropora millepora]
MDGRILVELKDCSITFVGLVGLQLPCMVSRASPSSPFARLRSLGFLFNMSTSTLNKHFAFSPENLAQGRYHTLISNLFHHVDEQHLLSNLAILIPDGFHVHRRFGRKHLLAIFLGGGVVGNLSQLCFYIFHQTKWGNILPSPKTWGFLGDFIGSKAEILQTSILDKVYTSVYGNAPCMGASAAVCAIIAVQTCANIVSLYDKYMELRRRQRMGTADPGWQNRVMRQVIYEVCHLGFVTGILFMNDVIPLIDSAQDGKGIIDSLLAYQSNGIGHAAHLGGFLFGFLYYVTMLTGYRDQII